MEFLLAVVLLSSGVLAAPSAADLRRYSAAVHDAASQHLLQVAAPQIPEGISQECITGWTNLFDDMAFVAAWSNFTAENINACFNIDPNTFLPDPSSGGSDVFKVEPCDAGVSDFKPVCEDNGGYMCQVSVETTVRFNLPTPPPNLPPTIGFPGGSYEIKVIVSSWQCLPATCSDNDYNAAFDNARQQVETITNTPEFNGNGVDFDVDFALFCDAGNGRPANFGEGSNTRVTINGTVDADAAFTLSCAECDPAWSVSVDIPADFDAGQFSNLLAAGLNADVSFDRAGCLSVWINEGETYNVYCPDDADITVSFDLESSTGTGALLLQDGAQPITNFNGNGITAEGTRQSFRTNVVGGASALAPSALATVALAALAAVAASN